MLLVIDSSAALRAGQSGAAREDLEAHQLIAPPLLWSEVYAAVRQAEWRRDVDRAGADGILRQISELGIRTSSPAELHVAAYEIAVELGWARTYDAEFLALARIAGSRVLTTDERLRRGAARTGLVIDPSDL